MTFLTMLSVIISTDDTPLYSKCDQASDLWQHLNRLPNLNLNYKTLDWGKKWLVYINAEKTQLVSFD